MGGWLNESGFSKEKLCSRAEAEVRNFKWRHFFFFFFFFAEAELRKFKSQYIVLNWGTSSHRLFCARKQHCWTSIWSSTSALSFCIDCQKCEVPLPHPHFRSAFTAKYVKFCSRASALPLLAKIWSSAFRTCSARTSKDVKFRFRISSLPGLPKICSFASALSLSLDCQRSEDRLLH